MKHYLDWKLTRLESINSAPDYFSCKVPSAVQADYAKRHGFYHDWQYAENFKKFHGLEDSFWKYRAVLDFDGIPNNTKNEAFCYNENNGSNKNINDKQIIFVCGGIDYEYKIFLDGKEIFYNEGMFAPITLNLTGSAKKGSILEVLIYPVPKRAGATADRVQADESCKPPQSYEWDWHPRLIPQGIWDETYILLSDDVITDFYLDYAVADDYKSLTADIVLSTLCGYEDYTFILTDREGNEVINTSQKQFVLKKSNLWYCHNVGEQYLYSYVITAKRKSVAVCEKSGKIGFRRIELVMNEGAWSEPSIFPKSRSVPPFTIKLNGKKVFGKGSNWISPEVFPGDITYERYHELLTLVKGANMNILRVWGGGIINKDSFYQICDELGIMVWQEFMLSCNNYKGKPHLLTVLDREARAIIKRVKIHPSIVMWCGGNELFNGWSAMTDQSLVLRLLNKICYELDKFTPFIPTSPIMGVGHGAYMFLYDDGRDILQHMNEAHCTAYTEFGCPSVATLDQLKTIIPPEELYDPKEGGSYEAHHAFVSWREGLWRGTWMCREIIDHYFGKTDDLTDIIKYSEILQCVGYTYIFEEARRQAPYCSMAINWCYNEPWLTAANNSIVSYPAVPKKGYYAVQKALAPIKLSLKAEKFVFDGGEEFYGKVVLLNDSGNKVDLKNVKVSAVIDGKSIAVANLEVIGDTAENLLMGSFSFKLPTSEVVKENKTAQLNENVADKFKENRRLFYINLVGNDLNSAEKDLNSELNDFNSSVYGLKSEYTFIIK